jgi:hypothetical protein
MRRQDLRGSWRRIPFGGLDCFVRRLAARARHPLGMANGGRLAYLPPSFREPGEAWGQDQPFQLWQEPEAEGKEENEDRNARCLAPRSSRRWSGIFLVPDPPLEVGTQDGQRHRPGPQQLRVERLKTEAIA